MSSPRLITRHNVFGWITILAIIPVLIIDLFSIDLSFLPDDLTMKMILVAIGGIGATVLSNENHILASEVSATKRSISEVLLLSRGRIAAIRPAQNASIWHDFQGNFFALNPPMRLNHSSNESYDEMVRTHAERFNKPQTKNAYYVFFKSGEPGRHFPDAFSQFVEFANRMKAEEPSVEEKLRIILSDRPAPGYTFFLGSKQVEAQRGKESISYAIFYTNDKPFVFEQGLPNWSFVSTDAEFNGTLDNIMAEYIDGHHAMTLQEAVDFLKKP